MSNIRETRLAVATVSMMASLVGCGAPAPPPSTGGGVLPAGVCGRGLVVVQSDYQSTNVSLVGLDGEVISSSFLSSGSAAPGLSAALSGDVSTPTARVTGQDVVLIDRYPASVITWVDIETAEVRAQLDVRTGFASNPQDYLRVSPTKAYVSRLESNGSPGEQPYDEGGDLLIVDPSAPKILGRIDLHEAMGDGSALLPRANRMVRVGDRVAVLLSAYADDFMTSGSSRLALIDPATDALTGVTVLDGLGGCAGLTAESPSAAASPRVAVVCSGGFGGDATGEIAESGVALLRLDGEQLVEEARFAASEVADQPLGFTASFAGPDRLLLTAMGRFASGGDPERSDALVGLDLASGQASVLLEAEPFELGEVQCLSPVQTEGDHGGCGSCWAADAERGVVHRLEVGASMSTADSVVVDEAIGLPPRYLGWL